MTARILHCLNSWTYICLRVLLEQQKGPSFFTARTHSLTVYVLVSWRSKLQWAAWRHTEYLGNTLQQLQENIPLVWWGKEKEKQQRNNDYEPLWNWCHFSSNARFTLSLLWRRMLNTQADTDVEVGDGCPVRLPGRWELLVGSRWLAHKRNDAGFV